MNNATFFTAIKRNVFGGKLTQSQVDGINQILLAGAEYPLAYVAYALATAYGETGGAMQPVEENMRYSSKRIGQVFSKSRRQGVPISKMAYNPELLANTVYGGDWGNENLGNIHNGDGWKFRGRGLIQATGRDNYRKLSAIIGIDFLSNPDEILMPEFAAKVTLLEAMASGIYTGKAFRDYLPLSGYASFRNFDDARAIINGRAKGDDKYAKWAMEFQDALFEAGFSVKHKPDLVEEPKTKTIWEIIMGWFMK